MHNHKFKLNKYTNDDNLGPMYIPGTPEDHKYTTSHFDVINKRYQRTHKQGNIDSDKQNQVIKNPYKKNYKTETLSNKKKCVVV